MGEREERKELTLIIGRDVRGLLFPFNLAHYRVGLDVTERPAQLVIRKHKQKAFSRMKKERGRREKGKSFLFLFLFLFLLFVFRSSASSSFFFFPPSPPLFSLSLFLSFRHTHTHARTHPLGTLNNFSFIGSEGEWAVILHQLVCMSLPLCVPIG